MKVLKNQVLIKFMISYSIILLIPIILGAIAYVKTLQFVEEEVKYQNHAILEQSKDILDARFSEVDSIFERMALSKDIVRMMSLLNPSIQKDTVYSISEIQDKISAYKVNNNFIRTFFIHFSYNDIIISPYDTYLNINNFYENFFKYGDLSYSQWRSEMLEKNQPRQYLPAVPVMLKDLGMAEVQPMITVAQTIPVYGSNLNKATMIMLINESEIQKFLKQLNLYDGGWAYITDSENRLLTSTLPGNKPLSIDSNFTDDMGVVEQKIDDKVMSIYYCISKYNGWKYVAVLPKSAVMAKANYVKQIILGFFIISLLLGWVIAYVMAYRDSKPLTEIMKALNSLMTNDKLAESDSLAYMKNSVTTLIANNSSLQEKILKQVPLLRATFLNNLLNGEVINIEELQVFLEQSGITFHGKKFVVMLVKINFFNGDINSEYFVDLNAMKILVKEALTQHAGQEAYLHDVDFDKIMVLMNFSQEEISYANRIEEIAYKVKKLVHEKYNIVVSFATGNLVDGLANIALSFSEAKNALDYKVVDKGSVIKWYRDVPMESKGYYYPVDIEMRFINLAKAGDLDGIQQILKVVYSENFLERKLSGQMMKYLINNMNCTVVKIVDLLENADDEKFMQVKESINKLENCATAEEFFGAMLNNYTFICNDVNTRKKSNNTKLKEAIIDFINQNFTDTQISLASVASEFGLTDGYLSQFFKEQSGENFSTYLEKLRVTYATNLLRISSMTIDDISEKSGYNSAHVFRSAFKRIEGVSPSAYRSSIKV